MENKSDTLKVFNPFPKGTSGFSWFFEQSLYLPKGLARAIKSSEGSGNIPKVVINENKR